MASVETCDPNEMDWENAATDTVFDGVSSGYPNAIKEWERRMRLAGATQ